MMNTTYRNQTGRFAVIALLKPVLIACLIIFGIFAAQAGAEQNSQCIKMSGPFYNYRIIDSTLFAGGSFFKMKKESSTLKETIMKGLAELKKLGVTTVIKLNRPSEENSYAEGLEEEKLIAASGLDFFPCPVGNHIVPDASQTQHIFDLIDAKAFVHCTWGCDRTGAIIAKYLRIRKGYSGQEAWNAILKGGSHSGNDGGFAKKPFNRENVLYFWPEVTHENPDVCAIYDIPFSRK